MWTEADITAAEQRHGIANAVYDSLLAGTLTQEDARKLKAFELEAPRPCPDLLAYLESIISKRD